MQNLNFASPEAPTNIPWMSQAAAVAYRPAQAIEQHLEQCGGCEVNCVTPRGFTSFFKGSNICLIAFRGTASIQEYQEERIFEQQTPTSFPFLGGMAHEGLTKELEIFTQAFTRCACLKRHIEAANFCVLTGHSLGGCRALLAGAFLASLGKKVIVYTFGSPKVGNAEFVAQLQQVLTKVSFRVDADVIACLPNHPSYVAGLEIIIPTTVHSPSNDTPESGFGGYTKEQINVHSMVSYLFSVRQYARRHG